jgi:hypothetical protein
VTSLRTALACAKAHACKQVTTLKATPLAISLSVNFTPKGTSLGSETGFDDDTSGKGIPD